MITQCRSQPERLLGYLPWLVLLGYLTHVAWFLSDDAFISFRYVRNLVEGHGLVFNRSEYVEGYSNFLWALELAALWRAFGLRPEYTAPWLSVACTGGTLAALLWWVARLPGLSHRGLVGWMALGLVCSSATFAVWTSGGGLETRQFTFCIVLAVVGLTLYPERRRVLLGVSLSLAAAALTRPEGPLFAACCFGWYVVQRRLATEQWRPDWRAAAFLAGPFVVLVAGQYLFRYGYYGEWLPNTYYAKHVRPWYEMSWLYVAAALETGLYLLLPLAGLAGPPELGVCPAAALYRPAHGLHRPDWGRPFRVSPVGRLLAAAGGAGGRGTRVLRPPAVGRDPAVPTVGGGSTDGGAGALRAGPILLRCPAGGASV